MIQITIVECLLVLKDLGMPAEQISIELRAIFHSILHPNNKRITTISYYSNVRISITIRQISTSD